MILNNNNLHQFLTTRRASSQNSYQNNTKISNKSKSNSNANINYIQRQKNYNIFSNLNPKPKEKNSNNLNNQNLKTESNFNKKNPLKPPTELKFNISLLNMSKNKKNSFKTLNYDRSPFIRIMKYFTIKSNNKPMELDELSPVFIPIRNTLSNEHRNNNNDININNESYKDKINFFYYINSKQKSLQIFKDDKNNKNNSTNNSHRNGNGSEADEQKNLYKNNDIGGNKINMIYKNDLRNSNFKGSDNNLTFSKNSNESEFTFKDKGSTVLNMENKKSYKKDNGNDSSHNIIDINNIANSFSEKDKEKIYNNKLSLINNLGKNNEISKNSGSGGNRLSISIDKINNKEKCEEKDNNNNTDNNNYNKNPLKFNYSIVKNEEKKSNCENTPKFINNKIFNNFINKETNEIIKNEKSSNLLEKILSKNQNIKIEKEINSKANNNNIIIDNNNGLKNSYQFRIRKINLPMGLNLASIQQNNKLLQNIINKKSKKTKEVPNTNKIYMAQTEYKMMKDDKYLYNK